MLLCMDAVSAVCVYSPACAVPLLTDLKLASFFVESLSKKISRERGRKRFWEVRSWDEYQP